MEVRKDVSRERFGQTLPLAQVEPGPVELRSPCAACPVRPLSICKDLSADELTQMESIMRRASFTPGAPIFDEGEPAAHRFNVISGSVKIYKLMSDGRRQIVGFLFPGDFLGLALADVYAYSAEAITGTELCRFPRKGLESLLNRLPALERRFLGVAMNELATAQDQMLLLGRKSAKEKVASFLLMLSKRAGERGQAKNPIFMPMTRSDLGDYLGLTMETVSRTISQLKAARLISLQAGHKLRLEDPDALQDMAEGD